MDQQSLLAEQFEADRTRLEGVAYRMLGSLSEAEDAVQEGWLRLSRSGPGDVANLHGWLTTVVARVCLDMLRARRSRREEILEVRGFGTGPTFEEEIDPEGEALLADSVGLALLVVLERLAPAERIAFVLHDMFDLPFDEVASIVGRSPDAARQLASRARRRVRGAATDRDPELSRQREVVKAFLAASRRGDFDALIALLDPEVVYRFDPAMAPAGAPSELRGAATVARRLALGAARGAQAALVNGAVGIIVAPRGRLRLAHRLTIRDGKVAEIELIADPARLRQLYLAYLEDS